VDHKDATASTRIAERVRQKIGRGRPGKQKTETIRDDNSSWLGLCSVHRERKQEYAIISSRE
jgi:hypothetical protein